MTNLTGDEQSAAWAAIESRWAEIRTCFEAQASARIRRGVDPAPTIYRVDGTVDARIEQTLRRKLDRHAKHE